MSHTNERSIDSARNTNMLGSLSLAVADRMRIAAEDAAGQSGSAPAALAALTTHLDGGAVDALAKSVGLTHSAAVRLVDRLEASGLVKRAPGADGRSVSVTLTPSGRKLGHDILSARERALGDVLEGLERSERRALAAACEKLLGNLTASRLDAQRICRLCDPDACGHYEGRCPVTLAADRAEEQSAR
jgi:DNA-binding MarR family transcriptional regulator